MISQPRIPLLAVALWGLAALGHSEAKLAILGLSDEKSLESVAVQLAVDASNSQTASTGLRLHPWFVALTHSPEANLALARKIADDSDVLGVVLHGEAAADPAIIDVFRQADLATVSASSWAQPRAKEAFVTWLCPGAIDLAESAAIYARREAKQSQVAVLDNGSPTAVAAAKAFAARFRALGGKVVFEGEWQGTDWGLTRTTKALKANWPQMLFFAGEAVESGRLVVAMKDEKELKQADLLGQPTVFEPPFFNVARLKSVRTRGVFPTPDFLGTQPLVRLIGIAFPKTSPEYRAYVQVAYKKPGRWAAMLFDATALASRAVREGRSNPVAGQGLSATAAVDLSATAAADAGLQAPSREAARAALSRIDAYRGIRGVVRFSASREPAEAKIMVYYALNRVNKKEMHWREKNYGPPF